MGVDAMKLFKRSDKVGAPYYVRYWERAKHGLGKLITLCTNTPEKSITKQVAAKLLSEASLRFHGIIDPDHERF